MIHLFWKPQMSRLFNTNDEFQFFTILKVSVWHHHHYLSFSTKHCSSQDIYSIESLMSTCWSKLFFLSFIRLCMVLIFIVVFSFQVSFADADAKAIIEHVNYINMHRIRFCQMVFNVFSSFAWSNSVDCLLSFDLGIFSAFSFIRLFHAIFVRTFAYLQLFVRSF